MTFAKRRFLYLHSESSKRRFLYLDSESSKRSFLYLHSESLKRRFLYLHSESSKQRFLYLDWGSAKPRSYLNQEVQTEVLKLFPRMRTDPMPGKISLKFTHFCKYLRGLFLLNLNRENLIYYLHLSMII